jgi:hypothetical protein
MKHRLATSIATALCLHGVAHPAAAQTCIRKLSVLEADVDALGRDYRASDAHIRIFMGRSTDCRARR